MQIYKKYIEKQYLSSIVQRFSKSRSIPRMSLGGFGENMCAVKTGAGAEKQVAASPVSIQYGVYVIVVRNVDGPGRQAGVFICIIN